MPHGSWHYHSHKQDLQAAQIGPGEAPGITAPGTW